MTIDDFLKIHGRATYLQVLDPHDIEGTIWFDQDDGVLTRNISKLLKSSFDGLCYCWTQTPGLIQDRHFIQFAQIYHWDPLLTASVREEFERICLNRMKGLISTVRTSGKRPIWIVDKLWKKMTDYWATDEAMERSSNASKCRNST